MSEIKIKHKKNQFVSMPSLSWALRVDSEIVSSVSESLCFISDFNMKWEREFCVADQDVSTTTKKEGVTGGGKYERSFSHKFERKKKQVTHGYNLIHQPLKYEQLFQVQKLKEIKLKSAETILNTCTRETWSFRIKSKSNSIKLLTLSM